MRLLIVFILAGFSSQLQALTEISAPQTLSKDNETYVLTQNVIVDATAFTIDGDNITFDLNDHVITYNNKSDGAGIVVRGTNNEVKGGYITQGADRSGISPAVKLSGTGHTVSYLGIKVNPVASYGQFASGIELYSSLTTIHHVYIENNGETNNVSYSPRGIYGDHRTTAGFTINDNIIFNSHLGISFDYLGLNVDNPAKTQIFNNYIQHTRTPGTKSPYGIALGKSLNVDIYNNQIISDDGRGIACDGLGQGASRGTNFVKVYNNRIDVEYRLVATDGAYVENDLYGIRDRYSSGYNSFSDNTIMVNNVTGGVTTGFFIGSDSADALMTNIKVSNNKVIVRNGHPEASRRASVLLASVSKDVSVTDNVYSADNFSIEEWQYQFYADTINIEEVNNTAFTITSYQPAKPDGLKLRKFFDSYVLTWEDNNETQTFEYVLYRDGALLDISTRGGTFYVDSNVTGVHTYTVVAKNLNGDMSTQSDPISTEKALSGWSFTPSQAPLPPQDLQIRLN